MRAFLLSIVSLLVLAVAAPASADDGAVIDTGKGLQFSRPDGWVDAGKKKGTVAALRAAGDKKSGIEFRYARVTAEKSVAYFNSFHARLVEAGLQKQESESKEYGELRGKLTEYATSTDGDEGLRLFVFQFHRDDAAWLVVGMFDAEQRNNYLKDYEALLTAISFE
jgi:hypothetical protein